MVDTSVYSKAYFFKGNQYIRYDIAEDKADAGYPKSIKGNWAGMEAFADGVDAVINWGNGKAYFFKGNQYIRYDIAEDKADTGYPMSIKDNNYWPGLDAFADGVDAVINWGNGKAYFFKGNQYIRYDIAEDKADAGYPMSIKANNYWPGLDAFADGVDAVVNWGNGKAYFFKGNQYIRYDIAEDKADAGYPMSIKDNNYWPGMEAFADGVDAAVEWGNAKQTPPDLPPISNNGTITTQAGKTYKVKITVNIPGNISYNNSFGIFAINDDGSVARAKPGESNYAQTVVTNRIPLSGADQGSYTKGQTFEYDLPGGPTYSVFLIANGTPTSFLEKNPQNQGSVPPLAYFFNTAANPDGKSHVKVISANEYGFEDTYGGGDQDFDDLIVKLETFELKQ
ncbi:hemopexin repeat-containing protein (plasmid) [Nostoc sp. UHCC 0302]|uniref:hemopexin repeat-containing protein n=1 Tax=Nostoc sp. UHCC 0302 TaxID=3134896 RepID=UPI00311CA0F0